MNFGEAIKAAKEGKKITRRGWNGKGMYVIYRTGYPEGIPCNKNTAKALGVEEGTKIVIRPYLQMYCADGTYQMWLASQSDILAEDWEIRAELPSVNALNVHTEIINQTTATSKRTTDQAVDEELLKGIQGLRETLLLHRVLFGMPSSYELAALDKLEERLKNA